MDTALLKKKMLSLLLKSTLSFCRSHYAFRLRLLRPLFLLPLPLFLWACFSPFDLGFPSFLPPGFLRPVSVVCGHQLQVQPILSAVLPVSWVCGCFARILISPTAYSASVSIFSQLCTFTFTNWRTTGIHHRSLPSGVRTSAPTRGRWSAALHNKPVRNSGSTSACRKVR